MIVLLFASSSAMVSNTLVTVRPLDEMFCIVLSVIIVNIIVFFLVQLLTSLTRFCLKSIDDSTYSTANLLSELISVRDGLCDIAIDFTKEELLSIFENICTC
jgi:hypothetical protein